MAATATAPADPANPQQQAGTSWKQTIIRMIVFQLIMRFIFPRPGAQQPARDAATGGIIPPLSNAFSPGTSFDVYVHIAPFPKAKLADLVELPSGGDRETAGEVDGQWNSTMTAPGAVKLVWFLPNETYIYDRRAKDRKLAEAPASYLPPRGLLRTIIEQQRTAVAAAAMASEEAARHEAPAEQAAPTRGSNSSSILESLKRSLNAPAMMDMLSGASKTRRKLEMRNFFESLYLVVSAVPHSVYNELTVSSPQSLQEAREFVAKLNTVTHEFAQLDGSGLEPPDALDCITSSSINLIEYMKPSTTDSNLHSLLDDSPRSEWEHSAEEEVPFWKNHADIRIVFDNSQHTPNTLAVPHLKRFVQVLPERRLYRPIVHASDMWLLEKNFLQLNDTVEGVPLNLTLSFNAISPLWWMLTSQLADVWNPNRNALDNSTDSSVINPLFAMQSHSRRESFMLKRILLDTNPYLLAFSGAFMALHTIFSFLAFKNDIQFWRSNSSMQGFSVRSIVFNFICEIIIALYLYDSEETSFLILFEIFLGLAISAWKVSKAINVSLSRPAGRWLPRISLKDKEDYVESETKKYDAIAIKFMSAVLLPCFLGYCGYSLKYKKFKSWYSFVVSSLAGTVYTFGLIMMTPQLYINYKLRSVDHLPWRAFTYKALNTFVDDIAAFIIDMPWMHRLACFRDDVIFVCYLYQRWIYSVDKSRPSEWIDSTERDRLLGESAAGPPKRPEAVAPPASQSSVSSDDAADDEAVETFLEDKGEPVAEGAASDGLRRRAVAPIETTTKS